MSSGNLQLIVLPDASGRLPDHVEVGCRTGPYFPAGALDVVAPVAQPNYEFVVDAIEPFLSGDEGAFWPQSGWQVLHETGDTVLIVHIEPAVNAAEPTVSFMTVELGDAGWRWAGSRSGGECQLTTRHPEGLNRVEWRLDPARPVGPESTVLTLLATELECAGGREMGDRLLPPDVVLTAEAVFVAFAATANPGAQTCQGNPETEVTIELPEPLGNRSVLDGMRVAGYLSDYIGAAF